jgi:hypothetical protein
LSRGKWHIHPFAFTLTRSTRVLILIAVGYIGEIVEAQEDALSVAKRDGLTLFHEVIGETVDATLGEFLATGLARMLITIASVLELLTSNKELEDELVWLATHG